MNLRKLFNFPSKSQKDLICKETVELLLIAQEKASEQNSKSYDTAKILNGKCPKCGGLNLVDKISNVGGSGYVSGDLFGVYGSSEIRTVAVNHCCNPNCGHEWKKAEKYYHDKNGVIRSWSWAIGRTINGRPESWDVDNMSSISKYHAESLCKIFNNCGWIQHDIKDLRKIFKSIYD